MRPYKIFTNSFTQMPVLTLIRSKLTYRSLLWCLHLIQDIILLEQVQRRATKFILRNFTSNYKHRLIVLNLLPLMYWLEPLDIFLIKCLLYPPDNFNILNYVSFKSSSTCFGSSNKLQFNYCCCVCVCLFVYVITHCR